jgi:transcriptional regulator with XRE-family HTH domain
MKLRVLRAERQLSLREASARTGVDKVSLSRFERGLVHPQDRTLAKIAKGYGVPVEELLEEPALAGKAEAPEAGRTDKEASVFDVVREAILRQDEENSQAAARAHESAPQMQVSYVRHENEAMTYLLGRRQGDVEEAYLDLMRSHVRLEQENARLKEELARAHVND